MRDSVPSASTVEAVLHELAAQSATGCLVVRDPEGDEAHVYLREGGIYAVNVPGRRAMLGVRLVSSGALSPEALSEALEVQRTELEGWRLGELLVHLGYVDAAVVESSVVDHMTDALADLVGRPVAAWRFRKRKKTRQDTGPRTSVQALFDDLRERAHAWERILDVIGSTDAAPSLHREDNDASTLEPNERALLNKVDGRRTIGELAGECGFTLFEAGQVVVRLLDTGFLFVDDPKHDRRTGPRRATERAAGIDAAAELMDDDRALRAEAERRSAEDREREEAERRVEALRKAEAKNRAELERRRVAAEHRRAEAERAQALELQRLAAARKQEQAERIREAAAERDAAAARQRQLLEDKRLQDAEQLHRELEALAAKEAAEREAAAAAARREAEDAARRKAAEAAQRLADEQAKRVAAQEKARRAAEEVARIANEAAERAVREEAERITREDAERREREDAALREVERRRQDDHAIGLSAQASSLLTQLNHEAGDLGSLVPTQSRPTDDSRANEWATAAAADAQPPVVPGQTDTAMLLRELSSLNFGFDDERPSVPTPAPRPADRPMAAPLPVEEKSKKRKGLFGRG